MNELGERGGVRLELQPDRAVVTLSRPAVLNAQTPDTWVALRDIGETLPAEVRAVIVQAEGRAFSAGLDRRMFAPGVVDRGAADGGAADHGVTSLAGLAAMPPAAAEDVIGGFQAGLSWLRDPIRLTVAAVQGHAIGAGFQLALACDLRLVADDVAFSMAETGLGLVPDLGGTYPLVHAVGYSRAVEICLSGRPVGAEESVAIGLALRSVPAAELPAAATELVDALVAGPAGAVRETLALLAGVAAGADPAAAMAAERAAQVRRLRALLAGRG